MGDAEEQDVGSVETDGTPLEEEEQRGEQRGEEKSTKQATALLAAPEYQIRPGLEDRFQGIRVRDVIATTLQEQLRGRTYSAANSPKWLASISNCIRDRVYSLNMGRFKLIVLVQLGEMRGAGVKSSMRCLWDSECDNYATDMFQNDSLFCHATVYGIYFY